MSKLKKTPALLLLLASFTLLFAQEPEKQDDKEKAKEKKASVSFSYAFKTDASNNGDSKVQKTQVFISSDGTEHVCSETGNAPIWITSNSGKAFPSKKLTVFGANGHDHSDLPFVLEFSPNHGFLGIESVELTEELRLHFGAPKDAGIMIGRLTDDGPAAQAGLKVGDILTHLDGEPIGSSTQLLKILIERKPGDQVDASVWRDGETQETPIVLSDLQSEELFFSSPETKVDVIFHPSNKSYFNLSTLQTGSKPKVDWVEIDQSDLKTQLEALQAKINELEKKIIEQRRKDH